MKSVYQAHRSSASKNKQHVPELWIEEFMQINTLASIKLMLVEELRQCQNNIVFAYLSHAER